MNWSPQLQLDKPTPLCKIMGKWGSDKGKESITTSWHNYTIVYYDLFKRFEHAPITLFELGLGTINPNILSNMGPDGKPGASIRGWKEFFQQGTIYGADIDKDILFNEERIKTFWCDQTQPSVIKEMWTHIPDCDIIIEDGLHEFDANVCFFENSIHKLKSGGYYIIEDIDKKLFDAFKVKLEEWRLKYTELTFYLVILPSMRNPYDNNLLVIHKS